MRKKEVKSKKLRDREDEIKEKLRKGERQTKKERELQKKERRWRKKNSAPHKLM